MTAALVTVHVFKYCNMFEKSSVGLFLYTSVASFAPKHKNFSTSHLLEMSRCLHCWSSLCDIERIVSMYCELVGIEMTCTRHIFFDNKQKQHLPLKYQKDHKKQTQKGSREKGETEGRIQGKQEGQERWNRVLIWSLALPRCSLNQKIRQQNWRERHGQTNLSRPFLDEYWSDSKVASVMARIPLIPQPDASLVLFASQQVLEKNTEHF
jgi:hypothetical protein